MTGVPYSSLPFNGLEEWLRKYYFNCPIDIGSSGVRPISVAQLFNLCNSSLETLGELVLSDSETLGDSSLREVIATRFAHGETRKVLVTFGSTEALNLIFAALLRQGDKVIVPAPCYQQLWAVPQSLGCQLIKWPLEKKSGGFGVDFNILEQLLRQKPKLIVANFPHNPTGVSLTSAEIKLFFEMIAKVGAFCVWDGAFSELDHNIHRLEIPTYERLLVTGTLSKAYGLPGLRIGWCIGLENFYDQILRSRDYAMICHPRITERLALLALQHGDRIVSMHRSLALTNCRVLETWISERQAFCEFSPPAGGVVSFIKLKMVTSTEAFCEELAHRFGTLLVPGDAFGYPGYVRLGYGSETHDFIQGLKNLECLLMAHGKDY